MNRKTFFIKLPNSRKLRTERELILNKLKSIVQAHPNIPGNIIMQISGNCLFPAILSNGHAHLKNTPESPEGVVNQYLQFSRQIYLSHKIRVILLAPFPRLLTPLCRCNQSITYQDSVLTMHVTEDIMEQNIQQLDAESRANIYVLKSKIYLTKVLKSKSFFSYLLQAGLINKYSRVEKLAKKEGYLPTLFEKGLLSQDKTHLSVLGEEILGETIMQVVDLLRWPPVAIPANSNLSLVV